MQIGWEVEVTDEPDRINGIVYRNGYVQRFWFDTVRKANACSKSAMEAGFEVSMRKVGKRDKEAARA